MPLSPGNRSRSTVRDVLFLVADQWRGDTLGLLGTPGVHTPNLDTLARDSVTFTNHWCQASPCGPSRASLLTGTSVARHGQWTNDEPADPGLETLAGNAARAGLTPLLVGYTDTPQSDRRLYDPAFEMVRPFLWQLGFPTYRWALARAGFGPLGDEATAIYPPDGEPTIDGLAPSRIPATDSDVAWLTDAAIDAVTNRSEPWLLHVNWLRPHPPLVPPAPYHRLVDPDEVALPVHPVPLEELASSHELYALAARNRTMTEYLQRRCRIESVTDTDERHVRAAYYGLCAEVDHHVGRLIDELRRSGRLDSTLIIFLSDHGDALGDHWLYGRRGPFDGHFRVPCIVRDPRPEADGARGTQVEAFTENIDIMSTILDALGQAIPPEVEGKPLAGFLRGEAPDVWRSHVRYEMDWTDNLRSVDRRALGSDRLRFSAVRTDRHRLVKFNRASPLLFDLVEDPDESVNRAGDPTLAGVLHDLGQLAR